MLLMYEIIEDKKKNTAKKSGEVRRNENDSKHFFPTILLHLRFHSYKEKFRESMGKLKCIVRAQKSTIRKKNRKKERKKENSMKVKRYKEF